MTRSRLIEAVLLIGLVFAGAPSAAQDVPLEQKGWIGVRTRQAMPSGAYVISVSDKGPAKAAGIMPGDVIVEFDGQEISLAGDLLRVIASTPPDKEVWVVVVRTGQEERLAIKVTLINGEAAIEAIMRKVFPADAVCQRTGIGPNCEYISPDALHVFKISLSVYNRGDVQFEISFPDKGTGDVLPIPARGIDAVAIYGSDITRAVESMKPLSWTNPIRIRWGSDRQMLASTAIRSRPPQTAAVH
jgi:membrane-associated protease RseP (regulator of RpoE activity)